MRLPSSSRTMWVIGLLVTAGLLLGACGSDDETSTDDATRSTTSGAPGAEMSLTSPAFDDGGDIPEEYSFEGGNVSPPLEWAGIPDDAGALALVVDDPDAPGAAPFVHWTVWDFDASPGGTAAGTVPQGGVEGANSAGGTGYTGPGPPPGETHTYVFTIYALATPLGLDAGAEVDAVEAALEDNVIGEAVLTGTYPGAR